MIDDANGGLHLNLNLECIAVLLWLPLKITNQDQPASLGVPTLDSRLSTTPHETHAGLS